MCVKNDIRMPRVPVLARRGLAVITISSLLSTGFAFAADDEAAILERIKPVGQVNVAPAKAAAPAPATAAPAPATAAPTASAPAPASPMAAASSMVGSAVSSMTETVQQAAGAVAEAVAPQSVGGEDLAKGKSVYDSGCFACHGTGVAGAPRLGDAAAWGPRIDQGMDVLLHSALNGKNAMPPKGGLTDLGEADIKAAIAYMVSQVK